MSSCARRGGERGAWRPARLTRCALPSCTPAAIVLNDASVMEQTLSVIEAVERKRPPNVRTKVTKGADSPRVTSPAVTRALGEEVPAKADVSSIAKQYCALLPPEQRQVVASMAQQQLDPFMDLMFGDRADCFTAIAHGVLTAAEALLGRVDEAAMKKAVVGRTFLALVAQALILTEKPREACMAYGYCAHLFVPADDAAARLRADAHRLRATQAANREARKPEREIYRFWADAALKAAGLPHAERIHQLGVERGIWPRADQRPVGQLEWRLTARPFWDCPREGGDRPTNPSRPSRRPSLLTPPRSMPKRGSVELAGSEGPRKRVRSNPRRARPPHGPAAARGLQGVDEGPLCALCATPRLYPQPSTSL